MTHVILRLYFALGLLSGGSAFGADAITQFKTAMEYCAGENVARYDDGVSQANVVAKVLLGLCRRQSQALASNVYDGHSASWKNGFERAQLEQFTGFVLLHRAQKRK